MVWFLEVDILDRGMMRMELPGGRKTGRSKRRFMDIVKKDLQSVGVME